MFKVGQIMGNWRPDNGKLELWVFYLTIIIEELLRGSNIAFGSAHLKYNL